MTSPYIRYAAMAQYRMSNGQHVQDDLAEMLDINTAANGLAYANDPNPELDIRYSRPARSFEVDGIRYDLTRTGCNERPMIEVLRDNDDCYCGECYD